MDNELTEEDKANALEARIRAPLVWYHLPSLGLRIEDLQEKRYEEALTILKNHFLDTEITYKCLNTLHDEDSVEEFLHNVRIQMKDKASLIAVEESTGNIVAVIIIRVVDRVSFSRTFSKLKLTVGDCYTTVMKFHNEIEKPVDLHKIYDAKKYLKIFGTAFIPKYESKELSTALYKSAIQSAHASHIPVVASIFTSGLNQEIATSLGFTKHNEIYYQRYMRDGKVVFEKPGSANYGAALMAKKLTDDAEDDDDCRGVT